MRFPDSPAAVFLRYRFRMSGRSHGSDKRHWPVMAGKVPETGDKSEYLPGIQCFASAPRIGRVRQMSETIEDIPEMSGVMLRFHVCGISCTVKESYPFLFGNNTCLIAARMRAGMQRIPVTGSPQIEWGGREVSPYYRLNPDLEYPSGIFFNQF